MPLSEKMWLGDGEVGLLQLLVLTTHHPKRDGVVCFEEMQDYYVVDMTKLPRNGVIVRKRRLLLLERISWLGFQGFYWLLIFFHRRSTRYDVMLGHTLFSVRPPPKIRFFCGQTYQDKN